MFERFTTRARRVVVLAQEHARMLRHNYVGTEHLLLGLISEDEGVAARALRSLDISLDTASAQLVQIIGEGVQAPAGHIPFTPRAKQVLELAGREALQLGHTYVGTEHVLLGLLREGKGIGAQILVALDVDLNTLRGRVIELLGDDQPAEKTGRPFVRYGADSDDPVAVTQIIMRVSDLDASRKFYEAIGLVFTERSDQDVKCIITQLAPGLRLKLAPCFESGKPVTGVGIEVSVDDRAAGVDALAKLGHFPWDDAVLAQEVYVPDPDGNIVHLVPRYGLAA
ncbi:hypothetical protein ACT17_34345 [Mycolicibacterium conceptionense]|uniref:Clp R domain-containing protein n=1 Tax=Mycolicibacterium conceptionense TaxID=451644 RepID=A0A0J8TZJ1_9MYCO|nr:hypothetical protein ACT17_34345 [Mycolicibacterium conceptionense]